MLFRGGCRVVGCEVGLPSAAEQTRNLDAVQPAV